MVDTDALIARLNDARSMTNSTLSEKIVSNVTAGALVAIVERFDALVRAIESAIPAIVDPGVYGDELDDDDDDDDDSYHDGPLDDRVSDDGLVHYEDLDDDDDDDETPPRNPLLDLLDQTATPEVETKGKKGRKV